MSIYRLFAYVILSLAALIFIVLPLSALTLAHSNAGSQWLVSIAKPWLPTSIAFSSFEGSLADAMRFEQVSVSTPTFSAQHDYLALNWNPWRLLNGELAISKLTLGSGEIRVRQDATSGNQQTTVNLESVAVTLPIAVSITDFQLKESWLFINELPQQQVAVNAGLALSTTGQLSVTAFSLSHQYLSATATISATLAYPFDYQLSSTMKLHSSDYPNTSLKLYSTGNVHELNGNYTVADSVAAKGQFSASDLLSSLQWQATTRVSQTRINDWLTALGAPQVARVIIDGKLSGSGTEQTLVHVEPSLTVTYQDTPFHLAGAAQLTQQKLLFKSLRAKLSEPVKNSSGNRVPISGAVEVSGSVGLAQTPQIDVGLTLSEITYQNTVSRGTVLLSGPAAQLRIDANTITQLKGNEPNTIKAHAQALLEPSQLHIKELTINDERFSGHVAGTATVDWQSDLTIRSDLNGQLLNEPFSLLANVTYDAPYLTVQQFSAQWWQSRITASGRMAPGSQLSLSAQLAELKRLPLPIQASGELNIDATVEGDLTAPWFDITMKSNHLNVAGIDITGSSATITGDSSRHKITARATALATQWQMTSMNTVGSDNIRVRVNAFVADHESLEPLQLHGGPATIDFHWGDNRLNIASLCFMQVQLTTPACLDATTEKSITTATVSLPATDVALFNPFIAGAPFNLDGTINANARAAWNWRNSSLTAVEASISSSNLVLHGLEESIAIDHVTLELTPEREHFRLALNARAKDIGLTAQGRATLQQLSLDTPLQGRIDATLNDIALLQVVVPEISSAEGQLNANLAFSGSLQKLTLRPKANAQIKQLVLSETGTLITQAQLHVQPTPEQSARFSLNGSGQIGAGAFSLNGTFDMASKTLDATLQGNKLHVLDTPKVSVIVSPDVNVKLAQNKLSVTGNVHVPSAHISPPQVNNVQRPSADVVIKQQPQEQASPLSTYANITLSLGDNVNVSAYGFDGQLQGKLNITQADAGVARGDGTIGVKRGTYEIYGQELSIDRGELVYNGGPLSNPSLNLQVVRNLPDATASPERVGARVQGTLQDPSLTLFSEPPMPDSSILSYLMFGRAPNSSAESSNLELQAALLLTGDMADSFTQSLKDTFGFDEVAIDSATSDVNDTSLYIGKYITPRLYIKYGIGLIESTSSFFLRYQLTEHLWIESTSSTESQGGDLIYSIEK